MKIDVYKKLKEMGIDLPEPAPKGGVYAPVIVAGNFVFVSGQGCTQKGRPVFTGKVGRDRTIEEGRAAARICALNALSALDKYCGDLNKVKRVIKTLGFVASSDNFNKQPLVVNGCSELYRDIWGEDGVGARSAIGVNELPDNITVEIEFMFELE